MDTNYILDFIKKSEDLGEKYTTLDYLFSEINKYLWENNYTFVKEFIKEFIKEDLSLRLYIGLLTVTNRYKSVLSTERELLYNKTLEIADKKYGMDKAISLLRGLE